MIREGGTVSIISVVSMISILRRVSLITLVSMVTCASIRNTWSSLLCISLARAAMAASS
jgi:hypothetical protein